MEEQLSNLRKELWEVRTLHQKFDNLTDLNRLDGLKVGYQQQITASSEKYIGLEKKLERVRELVVGDQIGKLKSLIKKGTI